MRSDVPLVAAAAAALLGTAHSAWLPARPGNVDHEGWRSSWDDDFGGRPFDHGRPGWTWGPGKRPQIPPHYGPHPSPPQSSEVSSEVTSSTSATTSSTSTTTSSATTVEPVTSSEASSSSTPGSIYTLTTETTTTVSSSSSTSSIISSGTAPSSPAVSGNSSSALYPTSPVETTTSAAYTSTTTTTGDESFTGSDSSATTYSDENSTIGGTTSTIEVTLTSSLFNTTTVAGSAGPSTLISATTTSSVVVSSSDLSSSSAYNTSLTSVTSSTVVSSTSLSSGSSSTGPSSGLPTFPANSSSVYVPTGYTRPSYTIVSSYPIYHSDSCFTRTNVSSSLPYVTGTGSSTPSSGPSVSANSTAYFPTGSSGFTSLSFSTASRTASLNSTTSILATGSSAQPTISSNGTSSFLTGTGSPTLSPNATTSVATSTTMSPIARQTTDCASLCSSMTFNGFDGHMYSCSSISGGSTFDVASGQQGICGSTTTAPRDLCRVTLGVTTSFASETYIEVWMPSDGTWNGRVMATDNGGLNGCVDYASLSYIAGKSFAVVGDNGGHNTSAFNGVWMNGNNEAILDWSHRARHAAIGTGKQLVNSFYGKGANKAYYIGCSTGGQQGLKNAQTYPGDFDGIIAGSAAADFNHLQDWSGRFLLLTGSPGSDSYLSQDQWLTVQKEVLKQCDEPIDGVNDGIIEDPALCVDRFDSSQLLNLGLSQAQRSTVDKVHSELYDQNGNLLFPAFTYGTEYDGFRTGLLSGTVQGITRDWFLYGVYNGSGFDPYSLSQTDYSRADDLDAQHGYVSAFNPDLSGFRSSGAKLLQYHGLADPMITGFNAQRYYTKVSQAMGLGNGDMDGFYRLFRISGMSHCSVGGVSGAGAWMFGQDPAASSASTNVIDVMVDWVENNNAPDTLQGTKFWYDQPANGIQLQRNHCRFPYRTTYRGGDASQPGSWGCDLINDWANCGPGGTEPRTC